jgi:hypothetical protein
MLAATAFAGGLLVLTLPKKPKHQRAEMVLKET